MRDDWGKKKFYKEVEPNNLAHPEQPGNQASCILEGCRFIL